MPESAAFQPTIPPASLSLFGRIGMLFALNNHKKSVS